MALALPLGSPSKAQRGIWLHRSRLRRGTRPRRGDRPAHPRRRAVGTGPARRLRRSAVTSLPGRHLSPAHRPPHRGALRPRCTATVAAAIPLHQPDLPPTRGRVLRPPLPLRARQRRRADPGCCATALGPATRSHILGLRFSHSRALAGESRLHSHVDSAGSQVRNWLARGFGPVRHPARRPGSTRGW
jgi:hypothetical protein